MPNHLAINWRAKPNKADIAHPKYGENADAIHHSDAAYPNSETLARTAPMPYADYRSNNYNVHLWHVSP